MTRAFPDVSWVYLFRDPVEVMVSNLKVMKKEERGQRRWGTLLSLCITLPIFEGYERKSKPLASIRARCIPNDGSAGVVNVFVSGNFSHLCLPFCNFRRRLVPHSIRPKKGLIALAVFVDLLKQFYVLTLRPALAACFFLFYT